MKKNSEVIQNCEKEIQNAQNKIEDMKNEINEAQKELLLKVLNYKKLMKKFKYLL